MNKSEKGSIEMTIRASVGKVRLIPADGVERAGYSPMMRCRSRSLHL